MFSLWMPLAPLIAHASTHGIAKFAPVACAGLLLEAELAALQDALASPAKPMLAIVGGAKVSTKLEVLLATIADQLLVDGIANTFIAAAGYGVGKSLHEPDLIDTAREIAQRVTIPLPEDVMVATDLTPLQWLRYVALIRWARTK